MRRVTATMLEAFRRYKDNEYMSFDDMVAAIKGTTEVNEAMKLGTAVHHFMEGYDLDKIKGLTGEHDGVRIDLEGIMDASEGWFDDKWLREVPTEKGIAMADGTVLYLKCKADAVAGTTVVDHKVTMKPITAEKIQSYQDSMQWRAYLFAFGASQFMYNIMYWHKVIPFEEEAQHLWVLRQQEVTYMSDYATMGLDVVDMVHELYDFTKKHNLTDYLIKEAS